METMTQATRKTYRVGTLTYHLPQLLLISTMMVLATQTLALVCYNLVPSVKPILLDRTGASAVDIALILGTIPQAINFFLCPLISTVSDKTRTRIGRRMPYLIYSAPVLVAIILMIAWSDDIAAGVLSLIPSLAAYNVHFWTLAVLFLTFGIVFLFPGSVVYYLIADVIPKECVGRYMAVAAVIHSALSAGFNFCILKFAVDHIKPTFCILGALYLLVYVLLFIFVKEGDYPPVDDDIKTDKRTFAKGKDYVCMFFRQCFQHRIFVLLFLCTGLNQASNICRGLYNILFATKDIGMSVETYGQILGVGSVISAVAVLFLGKIMDKTHPMLIYLLGGIFIMIINVFGYFFVHTTATFAVIGIATTLMYAAQALANGPLLIDLLPRDKYGQFASANSMVNSVTMFLASWLGGHLTDIFGYRVMFVWDFVVTLMATLALLGVRREWIKYGGKASYKPPPIR